MLAPTLLESALESAPDPIVICDAAGCIVFANRACAALFGYGDGELLGQPLELLLPEALRERHRSLRSRYFETPRTRPMGAGLELSARARSGREFPVEIALSPVANGTHRLVIAAIRDISERRGIEAQLRAARAAAEQARQSACAARDLADRANQAKSRFLATASHDLRQPLQSLVLLNGMLRRMSREPALAEALAQQERSIGAMSRLLNALLDIGRLESGAVRPQISEFEIQPLLEQLRQEFAALAAQQGIALRVAAMGGTLRTDAALFEQVLRNLLSNALKYTRQGEVEVRCTIEPPLARIEVRDTGVGIAPEQLPLIFNEFYQIDTADDAPRRGYGLGLSIVNRIVQLLGLKLEVQSALGAGSRFRLTVPCGAEVSATPLAAAAQLTPATLPERERVPKILLIEDEAGVRVATALLLRAAGYEVLACASPSDAFAQLQAHGAIDLLISDYHLGGQVSGAEFILTARERLGAQLPAILLTGDTSMGVQGLNPDARWRIARKPLHADELLALIGELLER